MMKDRDYSVLFVGILNHGHNQRLVSHLREIRPNARVDFLASSVVDVPESVLASISNLYVAKHNNNPFLKFINTLRLLKQIKSNKYDIVSIQSAHYYCYFYLRYLRKMSSVILLTPWGSDVYRSKGIKQVFVKKLFKSVDKVSIANNQFGEHVRTLYRLPIEKTVCLDIGSDAIDFICDNINNVSREDAKHYFNCSDKYIITCSYNGLTTHRHSYIINAINQIKNELPDNLVLFFPFTYCATKEYANDLKQQLKDYNLDYLFFEEYLSVKELFYLRRAADMFIHIQPTDANSQSLQEYLLCGAKVVNGEWLRYSELESDGKVPYFLVQSLESLNKDILYAYKSAPINVSTETIDYIKSYGWKAWIVKWDAFFMSCTNK